MESPFGTRSQTRHPDLSKFESELSPLTGDTAGAWRIICINIGLENVKVQAFVSNRT